MSVEEEAGWYEYFAMEADDHREALEEAKREAQNHSASGSRARRL